MLNEGVYLTNKHSNKTAGIIEDTNNYFYGLTCAEAIAKLYDMMNGINDKVQYDNLMYTLPRPMTFTGSTYLDTGVKLFRNSNPFSILIRFSNGKANNATLVNAHTILHCMDESSWKGLSITINSGKVQVDYSNTSKVLSNIGVNDIVGHTALICKDSSKIRIYVDSYDNFYDVTPKNNTGTISNNLLVGCYQMSNGTKGRYWNGTVFDLKIWDAYLSEFNIKSLLS